MGEMIPGKQLCPFPVPISPGQPQQIMWPNPNCAPGQRRMEPGPHNHQLAGIPEPVPSVCFNADYVHPVGTGEAPCCLGGGWWGWLLAAGREGSRPQSTMEWRDPHPGLILIRELVQALMSLHLPHQRGDPWGAPTCLCALPVHICMAMGICPFRH